MRAIAFLCFLLCGCGIEFVAPVDKKPAPVIDVDPEVVKPQAKASEAHKKYALALAGVFDKSAEQFRQHTPSIQIIKDMKEGIAPAHLESYSELMDMLNSLRPPVGATEEQRNAADEARADTCARWAKELREMMKGMK